MKLNIKLLTEDAVLPDYKHDDDAAFNFYTTEGLTLKPGQRHAFATGVAMEIPDGYVGLIWDRSSVGIKHGVKVLGGVIDAGFRGEVKVGLVNLSGEDYEFQKGDKIAQMLIQKVERVDITQVDELSDTVRGEGWLGSTGR